MDEIFAKWLGEDFVEEYNAQVESLLAEQNADQPSGAAKAE